MVIRHRTVLFASAAIFTLGSLFGGALEHLTVEAYRLRSDAFQAGRLAGYKDCVRKAHCR